MASIADIWLKFKSFILKKPIVANIDSVVLLTSVPSETSILSWCISFIFYTETYFLGNSFKAFSKNIL